MSRYRPSIHLKTLLLSFFIPLGVIGVGYALFSQQLSVQGTARVVPVVDPSEPSLEVSSTRSMWASGVNWSYNMNVTISNVGTLAATGWEISIQLPAAISSLNCWNVTCILNGTTLTLINMSYNGAIAPGSSTSVGMSFISSRNNVHFNNYTINGDSGLEPDTQYAVVSGLTATLNYVSGWQSGSNYIKQYDVTVVNNSGKYVKSWRVEVSNWAAVTHSMVNIWNANYISEPSRLVLSGTAALTHGSSASFGMQLSVPSSSWAPSYIAKGRL